MSTDIDLNPLIRLKEALEGAQKNTGKMLAKLEKFEDRLTVLDDKMRPIQTTTTHYTKAKENISLTLVEVNKTYEYFRIANSVKDIIEGGLADNVDRKDFFNAVNSLSSARYFFENHKNIKSSSSVLGNIDSLLNRGISSCLSEFERLLRTCGRSVDVMNGQFNILTPIGTETTEELKAICEAFEISKVTSHFGVYRSVRVAALKAELRDLEAGAPGAREWTLAQSGPYERGSHPFRQYFLLAYNLLRAELQLWGSTLPSNEESLQAFVSVCEELVAELHKAVAPLLLEGKPTAGNNNQNAVIRQTVLFLVRLDILDLFAGHFEEFRDLCRPDVRHESGASTSLMAMRDAVVQSALHSMDFLLSASLDDGFVADKKTGGGSSGSSGSDESSSCDLHAVTGNVVYCCKEVVKFDAAYKYALDASAESLSSESRPQRTIPDCEDYVAVLLERLCHALETRASKRDEHVKGRAARRALSTKTHSLFESEDRAAEEYVLAARPHLFLANNLHFLLSFARDKVGSLSAKRGAQSTPARHNQVRLQKLTAFADSVEARLKREQALFCECIAVAAGLTKEDSDDFHAAYARDKGAQGRLLKAKFTVFNTGMEALLAQQGEWRIAAPALRETLTAQLVARVVPPYSEFHAAFSAVKFSKKHTEQYLRYSPDSVERHLQSFFGRT